jgi:hypothetical protein
MTTTTELNERIRELCAARGLTFRPWEVPPWEVDDGPSPWPAGSAGGRSWPKAQALRRKLIAEIKSKTARQKAPLGLIPGGELAPAGRGRARGGLEAWPDISSPLNR